MKRRIVLFCILLGILCAFGITACADAQITKDYVIVYPKGSSSTLKNACTKLQSFLKLNAKPVADDKQPADALEILIGDTNRQESALIDEKLGENDYRILLKDGKILLNGGCDTAIINAIAYLMRDSVVKSPDGAMMLSDDFEYHFDGADNREEYATNPDAFLCSWVLDFDTPEWLMNFEEKVASFNDPDGRMMGMLHRADWVHYPENSLESIISSIKMGVDCMELDLHVSKDGVPVLFHDDTLDRNTDWREKAGKNGLPTSANIEDWTYEELKQLRLKNWRGKVTEYQIATLEEAIIVCKGRIMFRLDKAYAWNWDRDVYPLIKKHQAWQVVMSMNYQYTGQITDIVDDIRADGGVDPVMLYYGFTADNCEKWQDRITDIKNRGYNPVVVIGDLTPRGSYTIEMYTKKTGDALEKLEKEARILLMAGENFGGIEDEITWDSVYEKGCNLMWIENGIRLQQYIVDCVNNDN
ncbi:MAG: glycerophosphodiester phosphodiesterase family protein [Clostridiales bacterium]|nr:glycerophosphodiester phosphodiesterase family protein [Clostridiales bacterium]